MSNIESVKQHWKVTWVDSGVTVSLGGYLTHALAKARYDKLIEEGEKDVKLLRVEEIITQELP